MFANVARSRLLPMSVPFRYFGAAVAFHVLAWAALLAGAREVASFPGGLGLPFAALHLATLGVLAMAAIGATLQLLPVATRQPLRSVGAAKLVWWLFAPGVLVFAGGAALYAPRAMAPGAALAVAALALYGWLLGRNLWSARGMPVVVAHGWAALAALAGLAVTGLALVARYEHGLALDQPAFRGAHLVLAAYGFMGLLAQVGLQREGQLAHVLERAHVLRQELPGAHALAVQRDVLAGVLEARPQALQLQARERFARQGFGLAIEIMPAARRVRVHLGRVAGLEHGGHHRVLLSACPAPAAGAGRIPG